MALGLLSLEVLPSALQAGPGRGGWDVFTVTLPWASSSLQGLFLPLCCLGLCNLQLRKL